MNAKNCWLRLVGSADIQTQTFLTYSTYDKKKREIFTGSRHWNLGLVCRCSITQLKLTNGADEKIWANKGEQIPGCAGLQWADCSFTLDWAMGCWKLETWPGRKAEPGKGWTQASFETSSIFKWWEPINPFCFFIQVELGFPSLATERSLTQRGNLQKSALPWFFRLVGRFLH